jgi:GDPmannose 4,6-dehydratase
MLKALVTGITGMDGSYLAELLIEKGYKVYGLKRRTSTENTSRIDHIIDNIELIDGDMTDSTSLIEAVKKSNPDEVYNLAAQSFVQSSFTQPEYTSEVTGLGALRLLEAVRLFAPGARYYHASTSELFGSAPPPQDETTTFHPRSPYGVAKLYAHWATINYRESYNMFNCTGILFNHEGPRRGTEFVTQKIAQGVASIKNKDQKKLYLGNLDSKRDWGYAAEYVKAMWLMLQQKTPDDFVIATGEAHTVREFCEVAFNRVGLDYKDYVEVDPKFYRPAEVNYLLGNAHKAQTHLGWKPEVTFKQLVSMMVDSAMEHYPSKSHEVAKA